MPACDTSTESDSESVFVDHPAVPFYAYRIAGPYTKSDTDERRHISAAIMEPTPCAFESIVGRELAAYPKHREWLCAAVRQFLTGMTDPARQFVLVAPNWVGVFDIFGAAGGTDTVIITEPPASSAVGWQPPLLPPSPAASDSDGDSDSD